MDTTTRALAVRSINAPKWAWRVNMQVVHPVNKVTVTRPMEYDEYGVGFPTGPSVTNTEYVEEIYTITETPDGKRVRGTNASNNIDFEPHGEYQGLPNFDDTNTLLVFRQLVNDLRQASGKSLLPAKTALALLVEALEAET